MAEANLVSDGTMAESEVIAMKETLQAQQQLLQKLSAELDGEREASATAASEAMDMILRLQGEKAAVKTEARQYERMVDEKLEHAETTLEIFEELLFQKDVEIASLENQVLAYKRKLVSLGSDPNLTGSELGENHNTNTDEHHLHNQNPENNNESVRRLQSLPPLPANKNNARDARKRDRSESPHHHHTYMIQTTEEEKIEKKPSSVQQQSSIVESTTHESLD